MTQAENFHNRGSGRRTGMDRRAAADRRAAERRQRQKAAATDRRLTGDRRAASRRLAASRRGAGERRAQPFGFGPLGMLGSVDATPKTRAQTPHRGGEVTDRDRARARRLPEDFLATTGSAADRITKVIRHAWPRHPLPVRAAMAQELLPVLAPMLQGPSVEVSRELQKTCEEAAVRGLEHRAH